jgi:high frequency lysogenization protein
MLHKDPTHARIIALAALIQTSKLVNDVARKGICDTEDFHALISSLFAKESINPEDLFGGTNHLKAGLMLSRHLLSGDDIEQSKSLMTYTASMIAVEKRLNKEPKLLAAIGDGMQRIEKQVAYFGSPTHESVIAGIAKLYGETVSQLKPRIIVHGKPEILRQSSNTQKVRALLFAGIRAAYLWRQHKGGHFRLLFGRKKLLRDIEQLLKTL